MTECSARIVQDEELGEAVCEMEFAGWRYGATKGLLNGNVDLDKTRTVFKKFVSRVLIEVSAYCNRQCVFCPNASGLRLSKELRSLGMSDQLLDSVIGALQSVDYQRNIVLHLYNEPMADRGLADKVAKITQALPKAAVWFNTNGDYLSRDALKALAEAKLTKLSVSLYGPNHGDYVPDYLSEAFSRVFEAVGQVGDIEQPDDTTMFSNVVFKHQDWSMPISVFARDFNRVGYDRAQTVGAGLFEGRSSPCPSPFAEFNIAWDGTVVPCCNIHPHEASHADYKIGRISSGDDMFAVYAGEALSAWRKGLAKFGTYGSPCDTCSRLDDSSLRNSSAASAFNASIDRFSS